MGLRVELNHVAVGLLLKSDQVLAVLKAHGDKIAQAAGHGVEVEERMTPTRAHVSVRAGTYEAQRAEAQDKVLTRALDAGRG